MSEWFSRINVWHIALFLGLVPFVLYGSFVMNEFVTFDDGLLITKNPAVQVLSGWSLWKIFTSYDPELYVPFTLLSYQIEFALVGANPLLFHITNLILHASNVILVFLIIQLLSKSKWIAFFCALLFAIHPLHTEAVLWMSARKDLLSGFFFLLSAWAYLIWREQERRSVYTGSIVTFLCALLAKVSVVTLPIALLLFDWYQGRKFTRRVFIEKIPYVALSVIFGLIALYGKRNIIESSDPITTLLLSFKSTIFYVQKLFIPTKLSVMYPQDTAVMISSPEFFIPILLVAILITFGFLMRKRDPAVPFGIAFFILILLPNYNNFLKNGFLFFASDRYAYLPSIGIFFLAGMVLKQAWPALERKIVKFPQVAATLFVMIALSLFARAYLQGETWRNSESLYRTVIRHYPTSAFAMNNLGDVLIQEGRYDEAVDVLQKALAVDPDLPAAHVNMGNLYRETGDFENAIVSYQKAIDAVKGKSPLIETDVGAYYLLGETLEQIGRSDEAMQQFLEVVRIAGNLAEPHFNLALQYHKRGQRDQAITEYRRTIEIKPNYTHAHYNLAALYAEQGKLDEAILELETLLQIDPYNQKARDHLTNITRMRDEQKRKQDGWREVWIEK